MVKHSAGSPGVSHRLVRIRNRDLIRRLNRPLNQPRRTRGTCRRIPDCAVLWLLSFWTCSSYYTWTRSLEKLASPITLCTKENSETKLQMLHISARRSKLQRCQKIEIIPGWKPVRYILEEEWRGCWNFVDGEQSHPDMR